MKQGGVSSSRVEFFSTFPLNTYIFNFIWYLNENSLKSPPLSLKLHPQHVLGLGNMERGAYFKKSAAYMENGVIRC